MSASFAATTSNTAPAPALVIPTAEMTCKAVLSLRAFPNYCNCYIRDHNLLELINYHKILPSTHIISTATQLNTLLKKNKTFDLCIGEKNNSIGIYARRYKPGKEALKAINLKEGEENRYVLPCCLLSLLMTTPHSHYFFFLLQEEVLVLFFNAKKSIISLG